MQSSSPLELEKDCCYRLLPDSESPPVKESDPINKRRHEETWHKEASELESQKHKAPQGVASVHKKKPRLNKYALAGAILASTNSILLGYDIGVMSGAVLYIRDNFQITSTQVEILVGSLNVCSLIGSLASGIGVGYSLMIAPVYTTEISPAMTRGFLSSLPEVFINVGILLGYISNYALSGLPENINWRLMLGLAALPAVAVALGVLSMPESPRWLVMKGRLAEAKRALIKTSDSEEEAQLRLDEMTDAVTDLVHATCSNNWQGQGVWEELVLRPSRPLRRILIAAIGVNFFMQASGNDAVVYYSPEVFDDAGISNDKQLVGVTVIMGMAKTSFALISALFLDHFGRRPLLMLGSTGMAISLAGLGLGSMYLKQSQSKPAWAVVLCVVAICADVSFFAIGLGPVTWVYSSEIFPTKFRAQGSSIAISINRLVSGIVAMTFLSISKAITFGGMFFIFAGIMAVGTIFIYFFLPETKGKSLEEIGSLFEDEFHDNDQCLKPLVARFWSS